MNNNSRLAYCAFLLPLIMCGSCQQGGDETWPSAGPSSQVTVKAQILESNTRTAMSEQDGSLYHVLWSEGEQILIGKTGAFSVMSITGGAGTTLAQFTGPEPAKVYGDLYAAVYPSSSEASALADGDYVYAGNTVPGSQSYTSGTFSDDMAPMCAVSDDGLYYQFRNLYSVIQLPITGKGTLRKIELFGNGDEDVAGHVEMLYSKADGSPVASAVESDNGFVLRRGASLQKRVTLTFPGEGLALSETVPAVVNVLVLPGTFSGGFSLHIYDNASDVAFEKSTTDAVTVRRSWVKRMKSFVYSSADPLEFEPDVNPWIPEPESDLVE